MTHTPANSGFAPRNPDDDGYAHLDADLHSLAAGLDRLGFAGRAAAPTGLEDRLVQSTLASLHGVEAVAAQASDLGASDRAAAPEHLEAAVFAESLPSLRQGVPTAAPTLRHTGHSSRDTGRHVRAARTSPRAWFARPFLRVAAVVALVGGAAIAVQMGLPKASATPDLDRVKGDMDTLFAAMESRAPTDSSDGADTQNDDLTNWLFEGAAS